MIKSLHERQRLLICIVIFVVACFYVQGFNGFWHGDDVPNLNRVYMHSQQGNLWQEAFRLFANPVPSDGAFYRPMMMLSLTFNYVIANENYSGWYLLNFIVHLANTLLVALVVLQFAKRCGCDATISALLAALLFGLCPIPAEAVYWVSARADGWVSLLSLIGLLFWSDERALNRPFFAIMLPVSLILALGFKESAAVLPLQIALLGFAWTRPLGTSRKWALVAAFVIVGLFLAWRAHLFGNAWQVYLTGPGESISLQAKLLNALVSIGPWWTSLTSATPLLAAVYILFCCISFALLLFGRPKHQWRFSLAFACASGGLMLATLLNLGSLSDSGEGGRLAYGPVLWLAISIGILAAKPDSHQQPRRLAMLTFGAIAAAIFVGACVLYSQLLAVWATQDNMRKLTQAFSTWADANSGLTMLIIPDHQGSVVMGRNAQGGIALEPIQNQPLLHRLLPTLQSEIQTRQEQFSHGLAGQLAFLQPRLLDPQSVAAFLAPSTASWPEHIACWSQSQQKIISVPWTERSGDVETWLAAIRHQVENCER